MAAKRGAKKKIGLNARDHRVIDAFFSNGFRKGDAMVAGGFSRKTAGNAGTIFWGRIDVQDEVRRRRDAEHEQAIASENEILATLSHNMRAGKILAKYKQVDPRDGSLFWDFKDATEEDLAVISELTTETYLEGKGDAAREVKRFKVKHADITTAAQLLMRAKGMLKDKLTVDGELDMVAVLQQRGRQASGEKAA